MMLGAVLEKAFRDHIYVELHSYPSPNGKLCRGKLCHHQYLIFEF